MSPSLICLGKIIAAHGIRGQVKVASYTENPEDITAYGALSDATGQRTFELTIVAFQNKHLLAKVKGVTDRNEAENLRGIELYVPRERLPETTEGEYYQTDLVGLEARLTTDNTVYGTIKAVHNFGAGDLLEVQLTGSKKAEFLSFTKETVPEINIAEGYLTLTPPEEIVAKED